MRIPLCLFQLSFSLLIMSTFVVVGEVSTSNGFATVPAAMQELSQPDPMGLIDLNRQMDADPLIPREPTELVQVGRDEHQQSSERRENTIQSSPWGVQVKIGAETTWLDPAEDEGWDQAEEILELNPQCFKQRLPSGKGLLDRLPLSSWKIQAQRAAMDGTEPPYLKMLSRLLSLRLASIFSAMELPTPTTRYSWRARGALTLYLMSSFFELAHYRTWKAAIDAAVDAAGDAAIDAIISASLDSAVPCHATRNAIADGCLDSFGYPAYRALIDEWNTAMGVPAMANVREAVNKAITHLVAQSSADAPPTVGLISKTAYRSAELAVQISMLKEVEAVVQVVFPRFENYMNYVDVFPMLVHPAAWDAFKYRHFFTTDEDIAHYWRAWLPYIDQFVDEAGRA